MQTNKQIQAAATAAHNAAGARGQQNSEQIPCIMCLARTCIGRLTVGVMHHIFLLSSASARQFLSKKTEGTVGRFQQLLLQGQGPPSFCQKVSSIWASHCQKERCDWHRAQMLQLQSDTVAGPARCASQQIAIVGQCDILFKSCWWSHAGGVMLVETYMVHDGTRPVNWQVHLQMLAAEIVTGCIIWKVVHLHRTHSKNTVASVPLSFRCWHFLLRLAFAMTDNKSQGQTGQGILHKGSLYSAPISLMGCM